MTYTPACTCKQITGMPQFLSANVDAIMWNFIFAFVVINVYTFDNCNCILIRLQMNHI